MAKKGRELIGLKCSACKRINYYTGKNKRKHTEKLELKKYCRFCKKHLSHKESKV